MLTVVHCNAYEGSKANASDHEQKAALCNIHVEYGKKPIILREMPTFGIETDHLFIPFWDQDSIQLQGTNACIRRVPPHQTDQQKSLEPGNSPIVRGINEKRDGSI